MIHHDKEHRRDEALFWDEANLLAVSIAMGRLKALKPRVAALPSRIGISAPLNEPERDRCRNADNSWRAWYGLKRWQELRRQVFVRDLYICQRTGVMCIGKHPAPNSPVANHKQPHRGNPDLFWDIDNIETVSKAVHDVEIQKEEQSMPKGIWD